MIEDLMFDITGLSKTWPLNHWFPWKTFGGKPIVQYILLDCTQHIQPPGLSLFVLPYKNLAVLTETYKHKNKMDALHVLKNVISWLCRVFLLGCSIGCFYVAFYHTDAAGKILQRHLVLLLLPLHTFSIYFISRVLLNWVLSSSSGKISVISLDLFSCLWNCLIKTNK